MRDPAWEISDLEWILEISKYRERWESRISDMKQIWRLVNLRCMAYARTPFGRWVEIKDNSNVIDQEQICIVQETKWN